MSKEGRGLKSPASNTMDFTRKNVLNLLKKDLRKIKYRIKRFCYIILKAKKNVKAPNKVVMGRAGGM